MGEGRINQNTSSTYNSFGIGEKNKRQADIHMIDKVLSGI